jgi:YD repeat-containing protein
MAGDKFEPRELNQEAHSTQAESLSREVFASMLEARCDYWQFKLAGPFREVQTGARTLVLDEEGRITRMTDPQGTAYDYSYDKDGQLRRIKISGQDGDADYWVKIGKGHWRSYDEYHGAGDSRNRRGHLELKGGDWQINENGRMYHSSGSVTPVPEPVRRKR